MERNLLQSDGTRHVTGVTAVSRSVTELSVEFTSSRMSNVEATMMVVGGEDFIELLLHRAARTLRLRGTEKIRYIVEITDI